MTTPNGQIMLTYWCSAACRHCLVMAAPEQDRAVTSVEDAVRYGIDSKCHLCFEARRHLVDRMPDEFGPRHVYQVFHA